MKTKNVRLVVCDASPLIFLAKLDQLRLIPELFGNEISVLKCVINEVLSFSPEPLEKRRIMVFLERLEIVDYTESRYFAKVLSPADSQTLSFAIEAKASWLITDDKLVRKIATAEGLKVAGVLGILVKAAEKGFLKTSEARVLIDNAIFQHGLRISINLYQEIIKLLKG